MAINMFRSGLVPVMLLPLLAACAGSVQAPKSAGAYKVGNPYQIAGKWYYPSDDPHYQESGMASWYGPTFHGKPTANGERFDENDVTAAHRTLPMPSWVEVTNLENGRKLTVRVNDRGPFAKDRIIDLSRRSAQLLGVEQQGTARVHVKRIYPKGQPPAVAAAAPVPAPVAAPQVPVGDIFVQVAALSDRGRAAGLAAEISRFGVSNITSTGTGFYRVRVGPFADEASAASVLAQLQAAGYSEARLVGLGPRA
ncbi:septal ring lytic transglycosylase RlpA family protein [Sphingosinicella soli]|uniref:Endolytic peptidoglycan transglycosylase RlpA n=1 Tax=Sphingosinicella soli TaxID=333708 RepID=A0A7W7AY55_9SPHN|nr:septal ring lytic transglycosylase RlpA family protein [Sphingosinicella soli]MBB4630551.1 rare lipoprotein A [Sphingosinicella soli]